MSNISDDLMDIAYTLTDSYDIIQSSIFSVNDLCHITCELFNDCIYFNNPDYEMDSITDSGFADCLWSTLSGNEFSNHPIRLLIEHWVQDNNLPVTSSNAINMIKKYYQELPGIHLSEIRHDHKRATIFVEYAIYATIGQLRSISRELIDTWSITVKTPAGDFVL